MTNANLVNYQELQTMYSSDAKFKALIDLYAERQRGRQDSTPPRMRRVLKLKGIELSTKELSEIMRKMQRIGIGRCVSGRHGKVSRFVWGFHLKSVADVAQGKQKALQAAPTTRVRLPKLQALSQAPATIPPKPVTPKPQVKEDPRKVVVRKAGFEIVLPLDMSLEDWKEAAVFLNNLSVVE